MVRHAKSEARKEQILTTAERVFAGKGFADATVSEVARGAANKIRGIIYGYRSFYQNHPDYASVLMLILKQNRKFLETEAYQLIREVSRMITQVVEEGITAGEFKADTDPYLVRAVMLGTIEHSVSTWLLLDRPQNLLALADPLTDIVIEGIRKDTQPKTMNFRLTLDPVDEDQRRDA